MNPETGEVIFMKDGLEPIPKGFVGIKNGDVLKHSEDPRLCFLVISITPSELKVRPIAESYALELELKRKQKNG